MSVTPQRPAPARRPGPTAPGAATTGDPVLIAHCRELLRLAEAGEIVALLATARYADRAVWKVASAGRFDTANVRQIASRFEAIVAGAGHGSEWQIAGNLALALPETPR